MGSCCRTRAVLHTWEVSRRARRMLCCAPSGSAMPGRAGHPRGERGDTPLPHGLLHPCLTPLPQPLPLRRFQRALV